MEKSVSGSDLVFQKCWRAEFFECMMAAVISWAYQEHLYLMDSEAVNLYEKDVFGKLAAKRTTQEEV